MDHYRIMTMHRYPSELCKLFAQYAPELNRHAGEGGSGATLLYHYIFHGFREATSFRLLLVTDREVTMVRRIFLTYFYAPDKVDVMTHDAYAAAFALEEHHANQYDMIIFDHSAPHFAEPAHMERTLYEVQVRALRMLKVGGIVCFEGYPQESGHHVYSTLSSFYLEATHYEQHVFIPHLLPTGRIITLCRKKRADDPYTFRPSERLSSKAHGDIFVLVTSSIKSVGNNTVFSEATRFRQLLHSIRSVYRKIPNAYVVVSETAELTPEQLALLEREHVYELRIYPGLEGVAKSMAEALVLDSVVSTMDRSRFQAFCKLSGRYLLLDAFEPYDPDVIRCKRLRDGDVMTRFFSIPAHHVGALERALKNNLQDPEFREGNVDIEHALGRYFPEMNEAALQCGVLGVGGFYAGNCHLVIE